MTAAYIDTVMKIIREKSRQDELCKDVRERVTDITMRNTSYAPQFRQESHLTVVLRSDKEPLGSIDARIFWLEGEQRDYVDVDEDTAFLAREYFRREETMNVLRSILLNQNKGDIVSELPDLRAIFAEADEYLKNERQKKEERWASQIAAIKKFLAA